MANGKAINMKVITRMITSMDKGLIPGQMGENFIGSWSNGKKNWLGRTFFLPDGTIYDGRWKDDKIWNAKLYDKEGIVIKEIVKGKIKQ
jgi:hypothetical protein